MKSCFIKSSHSKVFIFLGILALIFPSKAVKAENNYSFNFNEFEKKKINWGGYVELKWDHIDLNQDSSFYKLNFSGNPHSTLDRLSSTMQLDGNYKGEKVAFNLRVQASAQDDEIAWDDSFEVFEAYGSIKTTPRMTVDLGKKAFKWGKGYAWNPVAFIDRPKDPNDPEEALEGVVAGSLDLIRSFSGPLQVMAFTPVIQPVWDDVNDEFGESGDFNLAAKLYFLFRDTDIDFTWFSGETRSARYGVDFSKNLAPNFEVHGELAHCPEQIRKTISSDGNLTTKEITDTSTLWGVRYLTANDITTIIEYYHNGDGYSRQEMETFFRYVHDADSFFHLTGDDTQLEKASSISQGGYSQAQIGRNYLYGRISQKDPFDILYVTPAVTAIYNIDDKSYTLTPEMVYTGFTNWEMRLRFSLINGGTFTEYGEKQNTNKLELRIRYFF